MKISKQWLQEQVAYDGDAQRLADLLTMAGLEVDAVEPAAPEFTNVVVAEIVGCEQHPDADRLKVCRVSVGDEEVQIVCGAPNARQGLKAPLARVGGVLPGGLKIKKAKLRGVESMGMLCSARELGLSEDAAGLMELPADAPVGESLRDYLQLDDQVIEVDLTPNRGDCPGMLGVAREAGVLTRSTFTPVETAAVAPTHDDQRGVRLEAADGCPRYLGRVIKNVDPKAPTPVWMQERLRRAGIRSLGILVDVTNYVMLELGQPMHAFDLAKLSGDIVVRLAKQGEQLELLNGQTVELEANTLLITDSNGPLAMAGVMGGEPSSVGDETRDIFLESAFFAPIAIAGRARQYGLHTDSSHRFERGVDPTLQRLAMERATALVLELAGGEPGPITEAVAEDQLPARPDVALRAARIERLLGVAVPDDEIVDILQRLGMDVREIEGGWQVGVPSYRFDVALEEDLIEEVARVWGYDRVPTRRAGARLAMAPVSEHTLSVRALREALVTRGYQEAITYSFVDPELQQVLDPETQALPLANPLSAELAVMRTSLWPGLISAVRHNLNRQHPRVRLFEVGMRFRGELETLEQDKVIGGIATGARLPEQWGAASNEGVDFFDVKGDVEALLALTGDAASFRFVAETHPALHPGQSARIYRGDKAVGWLGAVHPALEQKLELNGRTFVFELTLADVLEARVPAFAPLSKFPSIRRDIAVVVDENVPAASVLATARDAAGELLRDALVFDVYRGKGIESGRKSLAIGLILQEPSRTLTDEDVDAVMSRVVDRLRGELGANLRE